MNVDMKYNPWTTSPFTDEEWEIYLKACNFPPWPKSQKELYYELMAVA